MPRQRDMGLIWSGLDRKGEFAQCVPKPVIECLQRSWHLGCTKHRQSVGPDPGLIQRLRISAIVDACFRLIVDGVSAPSWTRRDARKRGINVAQTSGLTAFA